MNGKEAIVYFKNYIKVKKEVIRERKDEEGWIVDSRYTKQLEEMVEVFETVLSELEKKDRLIDLIVNRFQQICVTPSLAKYQWKRICSEDLKICEGRLCEDCIIEYFTNKVEREGK